MWDLGEAAKVAIVSVTEGEDKPLKYPDLFAAAGLMVVNKIDLLPHVDFDVAQCVEYARRVNPDIDVLRLSARTGEGMDEWIDWLLQPQRGDGAEAAGPVDAAERAPQRDAPPLGPTALPCPAPARVLACGAFLKNSACFVDGGSVRWSALHGDLGDPRACAALERSLEALIGDAASVDAVAHDLHPDFHSTLLAVALAERLGVPAVAVQHHHAHIAAVQAEQGLDAVIGIALDGVGLGSDGAAWGGELLWVDAAAQRWRRLAHLQPIALPGGDIAAREPWRLAAAVLHEVGRGELIEERYAPAVGAQAARTLRAMLERRLNCPLSSSAGRWFDAAAGALGLSVRQGAEAEAALALERRASDWLRDHPRFEAPWQSLDLRPVVAALFDIGRGDAAAVARGAASFHLALAGGLAHAAVAAAKEHATAQVVLGGGCFMNRVLAGRLRAALEQAGLSVHAPLAMSCGDSGLALGQAWVAACAVAAGAAGAMEEEN